MNKSTACLFGICIAFFGVSCAKDQLAIDKPNATYHAKMLIDSVGYWHNYALTSVEQSGIMEHQPVEVDGVESVIVHALVLANPVEFDEHESDTMVQMSDSILSSFGLISNGQLIITPQGLDLIFVELGQRGVISTSLTNAVRDLYYDIYHDSNMDIAHLNSRINNLYTYARSSDDRAAVGVMLSVAIASENHWDIERDKVHDLSVIGADVAGALYGLIGSPVLSIIEGGLFSAIAAIN